jgi:chemotaxis protein CheX
MEAKVAFSLRESLHLVSDPTNLDGSVQEVFGTMLGVSCTRLADRPRLHAAHKNESVTAVVGFGGLLSGACVFHCEEKSATKLAALMTGMEFEELDDTVKDGIGEICNMLAGAWKGRVPELAVHCGLSVPAVITGHDYHLHVQAPEFELRHGYTFDGGSFDVTIVCDSLQ